MLIIILAGPPLIQRSRLHDFGLIPVATLIVDIVATIVLIFHWILNFRAA